MTDRFSTRAFLFALALAGGLSVATAPPAPAAAATPLTTTPAGQTYASADKVVAALVAALRAQDGKAIGNVLGPGSDKLIHSGDRVADDELRKKFLAAYDEKHQLVADGPTRMILQIGANDWPLPLPVVQADGRWHFDSALGAQVIVDRRIGEDEISAIRTALAYVDAQKLYFSMAAEDQGSGEYAQRLVSTEGHYDGLYWPPEEGAPESPLAPLIAQAMDKGYPGELVGGKPDPYEGYYFRILKAQGRDAPGGAMDYVADGRMTKGFALVAWPARFGASGIMTFIVNQDGVVFQKDLGEQTDELARKMARFDPDLSWVRVDVSDE